MYINIKVNGPIYPYEYLGADPMLWLCNVEEEFIQNTISSYNVKFPNSIKVKYVICKPYLYIQKNNVNEHLLLLVF